MTPMFQEVKKLNRRARAFLFALAALAILTAAPAKAQSVPLPEAFPGGLQLPETLPGGIPMPTIERTDEGLIIAIPGGPSLTVVGQLPSFPTLPVPGAPPAAEPAPVPPGVTLPAPVAPPAAPGAGRVVGVFMGISDYASASDLPFCADDARRVRDAFVHAGYIQPRDAVVLQDGQVTRGMLQNTLARIGSGLGPDDSVLVFFSGHGNQVPDRNGDEADGMDETIVLSDGALLDDDLAAMLGQSPARDVVALDSCYSGGFATDISRLPDSAGFYASAENQLSYVAGEYQAGGYLSYFFAQTAERHRGEPLSVATIHQDMATAFRGSQANGRQDLTVGRSARLGADTVLFQRAAPTPTLVAVR
jgi:hypothetical protein